MPTNNSTTIVFAYIVLLKERPKDVVIMEGQIATLSCTTSDVTTPVTWRRNSAPLHHGAKYEIRKEGHLNLLLIRDVELLDTGTYTCDTGDVQGNAVLTVQGKTYPNEDIFPVCRNCFIPCFPLPCMINQ